MNKRKYLNLEKEYAYKEFIRQEDNILRAAYNPELEFYSSVKAGDIARTKELCEMSILDKEGWGTLSKNELQNYKYHVAITLALVARYCIEGGMDLSRAYSLSDFYIQKVDEVQNLEDLDSLHLTAVMDYCRRMNELRKRKICSKPVLRCIDYIYDNLHTRITLETLAEHVHLSPTYLSKLFKKETGRSLSDYIQRVKVDTASNMLLYSEHNPAEIASFLAFPSQSYFTQVFKKHTGMTPTRFKANNLRKLKH